MLICTADLVRLVTLRTFVLQKSKGIAFPYLEETVSNISLVTGFTELMSITSDTELKWREMGQSNKLFKRERK